MSFWRPIIQELMLRGGYFEIREIREGTLVRLRLQGELDLGSAAELRDRLSELRAQHQLVRLDLSAVDFMDSSGVGVLAWAVEDARRTAGSLRLSPVSRPRSGAYLSS